MAPKILPILLTGIGATALVGTAQADVKISTKATSNMSCSGGVCTPTAKKAVLNVGDLANMLAGGSVTVNTAGSTAQDIEIAAALSWTSTSRLTLDAYRSITFNKPVTVAGTGALTITTNDGGSGGDFRFFGKGHVEFWDTDSDLVINSNHYTLTRSIKDLRLLVRHNVDGFYAFAKSINAKAHVYGASPIDVFGGTIEGLGNTISNLTVTSDADGGSVALIGDLEAAGGTGTVRDLALMNATIAASGTRACVGTLVGIVDDRSYVLNSEAFGTVEATGSNSIAGGLACQNQMGTIIRSSANVAVSAGSDSIAGGFVAVNENCDVCGGSVDTSYSAGPVTGGDGSLVGGLVGRNLGGAISNSYALGAAKGGSEGAIGGLVGSNENDPTERSFPAIATSYSIGAVSGGSGAILGGLIGQDLGNPGITDAYWDLDTSNISDPSKGAGNIPNDPGITGLLDAQFKSGLPQGFDISVWKENAKINSGYPYLMENPPS
jgi:hypothetical protein